MVIFFVHIAKLIDVTFLSMTTNEWPIIFYTYILLEFLVIDRAQC